LGISKKDGGACMAKRIEFVSRLRAVVPMWELFDRTQGGGYSFMARNDLRRINLMMLNCLGWKQVDAIARVK